MKKGLIVGIDFGTTNSAMAGLDDAGTPRVLKNSEGEQITPSFITFPPDGKPIVGREAKNAAAAYSEGAVREIKRQMGKTGSDGKPVPFFIDQQGKEWRPEELAALVILKMKQDGEAFTGQAITEAVITVPAIFNEVERQATINAGKIAGLNVLDVMNEPTAAALAYGLQKKSAGKYLVYDLGGGTFDATIIRVNGDTITALATDGVRRLGGTDFDMRIIEHAKREAAKLSLDLEQLADPALRQELKDRAERLKHSLSAMPEAPFQMNINGQQLKFTCTRAEFEAETRDLLEQTGACVQNVLKAANLKPGELTDTILVGGATRMPMVEKYLTELMGKPPRKDIDPDLAVAQGAALAAAQMARDDGQVVPSLGGKNITPLIGGKFTNVAAHDLGCAAFDAVQETERKFVKIIAKNTALPAVKTEIFRLRTANQRDAKVEVYQGQEGQKLEECLHIDDVELDDLPLAPQETPRIEVRYEYSRCGIVHVTVTDRVSGKSKAADISHNLGLTEAEVQQAGRELS